MIASDPSATEALRIAAITLVGIQNDIRLVYERTDDSWRRELIALRRRLQQVTQQIAELLETMRARDPQTLALRAAFGRMRSLVALHQANWPAVAIDRDDAAYQSSIESVREANRAFASQIATLTRRRL